jgi:hypothetical protein
VRGAVGSFVQSAHLSNGFSCRSFHPADRAVQQKPGREFRPIPPGAASALREEIVKGNLPRHARGLIKAHAHAQYYLFKLPDTITAKTERVRSPLEVPLWSSPIYFLFMLAVLTLEWVLRKMAHLK